MVSLEEFKKRMNGLNYEIIKYNGYSKKSLFRCSKHGLFEKKPSNFLQHQCNECTKEKLHNLFSKSQEKFINQAKEIFPFYDFSKTIYYNDETYVTVICQKHGEFKTTPRRLLSKHKCPICAKEDRKKAKSYTVQELIEKANKIHNNKYTYINPKNGILSNIEIVCLKHGSFWMTWNNHINQEQKCPACFTFKGEEKIETYLNKNNIFFERNKRFSNLIDKTNLSYDFFIPNKNLLIEHNGEQHYFNSFKKPIHEWHRQLHHDWLKRKYAKENKLKLLIIPYWDFNNIEKIMEIEING